MEVSPSFLLHPGVTPHFFTPQGRCATYDLRHMEISPHKHYSIGINSTQTLRHITVHKSWEVSQSLTVKTFDQDVIVTKNTYL